MGAPPGIFWRSYSLLGAALAEPWWALFSTQVRSRCPSLVSLSGVVLVETRHTLVLQGEDGAKRRVPKAGSTFVLTLPAVDGGTIAYSDTQAVGSVATYSCDSGNAPTDGDASRTCQADATWDGSAPGYCGCAALPAVTWDAN